MRSGALGTISAPFAQSSAGRASSQTSCFWSTRCVPIQPRARRAMSWSKRAMRAHSLLNSKVSAFALRGLSTILGVACLLDQTPAKVTRYSRYMLSILSRAINDDMHNHNEQELNLSALPLIAVQKVPYGIAGSAFAQRRRAQAIQSVPAQARLG
jgi:hypothetical protein